LSFAFQFHIGAIRSNNTQKKKKTKNGFNSILVQLEVGEQVAERPVTLRFNSILVQLEVSRSSADRSGSIRFNSILVQLEGDCKSRVTGENKQVSIPYWCN